MKNKSILRSVFLSSLLVASLSFSSCDEEEVSSNCTGCPSSSPWGTSNSSGCYDTAADCEAAEGVACVLCD